MSKIGYYRIKVKPENEGLNEYPIYINGELAYTAKVYAREFCNNYKYIKYLDRSGRYRFFVFENKWERRNKPRKYGDVNKLIESIYTTQSASAITGYKNEVTLILNAALIDNNELEKLEDIFYSPKCYLYIGNGSNDETRDWIEVEVSGDGIGRNQDMNHKNFKITVKLPEYYAISKI